MKALPQMLRRAGSAHPALQAAIILLIGYFLTLPMLMLITGAFIGSPYAQDQPWVLDGFRNVLSDDQLGTTILSSLVLSFGVALLSIAGGTYFAVIATRFSTRCQRLVTPMMIAAAAMPGLFYAISWSMLANPNAGMIAKVFAAIGLPSLGQYFNAVSWPGLIIVSSLKVTGFAYLFLIGPMSAADRSQEDAAVISGASRFNAFFGITLPSLAPAYLAVGMLLIISGLQSFDIPAILGYPIGIKTLSLRVQDYLVGSVRPDWHAANAISVITMLFVAALVVLQVRMLHGNSHVSMSGKAQNVTTTIPKYWARLIDASIIGFLLIALLAPILQFIIGSFQPFFGLYGAWTLDNYTRLFDDPVGMGALRTTIMMVLCAAPLTVLIGFLMAYVITRAPHTRIGILVRIGSWVPATAPGIVLSVALLFTYINTPGLRSLFGTPWLMVLALMIGAITLAVRAAEGMIAQVSVELEEAALISGAGKGAAVFGIVARLCAPSLLGAWLLISLWMSGTLDIPMLLQSSKSQTVATYAYGLVSQGEYAVAAATFICFLGLFALIVGLAALFHLLYGSWRKRLAHISETPAYASAEDKHGQ